MAGKHSDARSSLVPFPVETAHQVSALEAWSTAGVRHFSAEPRPHDDDVPKNRYSGPRDSDGRTHAA